MTSLRTRLLLLVLLAVLPALGLMLYTAAENRQRTAAGVQADALTLIQLVSADQERVIEGAHQLLTALAQLRDVSSDDPAACSDHLTRLLPLYPGYTGFGAVAPDGNMFCSTVAITQPLNVADRAWFQRAMETHHFAGQLFPQRDIILQPVGAEAIVFQQAVHRLPGRVLKRVLIQIERAAFTAQVIKLALFLRLADHFFDEDIPVHDHLRPLSFKDYIANAANRQEGV